MKISMGDNGYKISYVYILYMLFVTFLSMISYGIWFIYKFPIGPGIRMHADDIYFITLLTSSSMNSNLINLGSSETSEIWQMLDGTFRVGEGINSIEDEIGQLVLEKPAVVRNLINGRRYI